MKSSPVLTTWFDIPAKDLDDAKAFYEGLFNWTFVRLSDGIIPDYWVIQTGENLIGGMRKSKTPIKDDSESPVIYFTVDRLEPYRSRVKELGGRLEGEKVSLGKGRGTFQLFRDREKNLLGLWSQE